LRRIFAGLGFTLLGHSISQVTYLAVGADIAAYANSYSTPLNEAGLRRFFETERNVIGTIYNGSSFQSFSLDDLDFVSDYDIYNLPQFPGYDQNLYGVERNTLDVAYSRFFQISESNPNLAYSFTEQGVPDLVKSLYDNAGKLQPQPIEIPSNIIVDQTNDVANEIYVANREQYTSYWDVFISEALRNSLSVNAESDVLFRVRYYRDEQNVSEYFALARTHGLVSKMPGFFFSSYRQTAGGAPTVCTLDLFQKISKRLFDAYPKPVREKSQN
jgi:hypothetical protein